MMNSGQHTIYVTPDVWEAAVKIIQARNLNQSMSSVISNYLKKIVDEEPKKEDNEVKSVIEKSLYGF